MPDAREQTPGGDTPPTASDLSARLTAVERALTDDDTPVVDLEDAAELTARLDDLEATIEELDSRLAELDAATQALRGFLGGVRAVNRDVERRANAALAKVESLEQQSGVEGLHVERFDDPGDHDGLLDDPDDPGGLLEDCNDAPDDDTASSEHDGEVAPDSGLESLAARLRDAL